MFRNLNRNEIIPKSLLTYTFKYDEIGFTIICSAHRCSLEHKPSEICELNFLHGFRVPLEFHWPWRALTQIIITSESSTYLFRIQTGLVS